MAPLSREGPGLLLRDLLGDEDPQVDATLDLLGAARPDILLLAGIDWDAEGAALGVLRDLGADETRGYLHSRPLAPAAFEAWLAERAPGPGQLPGPRRTQPA